MPTLDQLRDVSTVIGTVVAVTALVKIVIEYIQQGAQKRAEKFAEIRSRLKSDDSFQSLCNLLETDDPALLYVPFHEKRDFLGLFEEVALMMNSGLLRRDVAHYMFGYYAIKCWQSANFWIDVNKNSPYWALFAHFAETMEGLEGRFVFRPSQYHF